MSVEYTQRNMSVLENITSVVADSDLDGLMAAAILKAAKPELTVEFSHAALIRSGLIDEKISKQTALCDLPFHPNCGLYLDHHMTNRPSPEEEKQFVLQGGICHWRDTPSAARAAYDLMKEEVNLDHLVDIMPIVDALDSGGISLENFLEDGEIIRLSRSLSLREPEHLNTVLEQFASGEKLEQILASHSDRLNQLSKSRKQESDAVSKNIEITDSLAICRMENSEIRTNGYLVTALAGDEAIACCVIHGWLDGSIDTPNRPALSASFYSNSFRKEPNNFDLSKLATLLDETGGGHANACGCRIQPISSQGVIEDRTITSEDIERNISLWLKLWAQR